MTEAERLLQAARELCEYLADEPEGWCGEGYEIASVVLDVLNGEPVADHWLKSIADARAAGWSFRGGKV